VFFFYRFPLKAEGPLLVWRAVLGKTPKLFLPISAQNLSAKAGHSILLMSSTFFKKLILIKSIGYVSCLAKRRTSPEAID